MMICEKCGSAEIQVKAWVWPNGEGKSDEPTIVAGAFDYEGAWCVPCDSETTLVEDSEDD